MVVVTGFGRCGSSLMMRMLDAAGMEIYCDDKNRGKSFETTKIQDLPLRSQWLDQVGEKAVKILRLPRYKIPPREDYKFIHMVRNPTQQAKSRKKLLKAKNILTFKLNYAVNLIKTEREMTRRIIKRMGPFKELSFEDQLQGKVDEIAAWLGLDPDPMRSVIVERSPECLPGLLEESMRQEDMRRDRQNR